MPAHCWAGSPIYLTRGCSSGGTGSWQLLIPHSTMGVKRARTPSAMVGHYEVQHRLTNCIGSFDESPCYCIGCNQ
jgi:hypothetical protein